MPVLPSTTYLVIQVVTGFLGSDISPYHPGNYVVTDIIIHLCVPTVVFRYLI